MKVYAHSINGEVQVFYKTEEQAQKCIDQLNNVFNRLRLRHGIDHDLRVASLEVFDIGKEAPAEPSVTTLQWEVGYTLYEDSTRYKDVFKTRKEARSTVAFLKHSEFYKDVTFERVEYKEVKREVVR